MRIGADIRELQRGVRTGIGRMVDAVVSMTPEICPEVRLFLYGDATTQRLSSLRGTEAHILPQPTTLWFDQVELPRALAREGVDVFWSPYYKAPLAAPCPTVITIHDLVFLKLGRRQLKHALFKPWAKLMASRAAVVLTDSEHSRGDLTSLLGLDPSRIEVVPLGVSSAFSPSASSRARDLTAKLGIPKRYVLSVTNFQPHKNDRLLIEAFRPSALEDPALGLVLAGRATRSLDSLRRLIDQLELRNRVFLPGLIPDEDLPALYAGARVFAFPSLYEGFGLPALEALASGVPVVCSSASSLPEVVGDAAVLLDPTDGQDWQRALRNLLHNEPLRRSLIQSGLERARVFTWRRAVAKLLNVLEGTAR